MHRGSRILCAHVIALACACASQAEAETKAQAPTGAPGEGGMDASEPEQPTSCAGIGTSTLDGVCIWLPEASGSWTLAEAAAGIEIPYWVIVEDDVSGVVPRSQDAGQCRMPGEAGLDVFERLGEGEHLYCLCDEGLCAPESTEPRTIPAGRTWSSFVWNGVSWMGPSDTDNPYGPPFPPGIYTLELSAVGTVDGEPFEVRNRFELTLTP